MFITQLMLSHESLLIFSNRIYKCIHILTYSFLLLYDFSERDIAYTTQNQYLFSIVYSCLLCCKSIDRKCLGLFLGFLFCSIDLCVCFVPVPYCVDYYSFVVSSEVRKHDSSSSVLSQDLAFQGHLCFHTNLKIICSSSVKNAIGILIEVALNL